MIFVGNRRGRTTLGRGSLSFLVYLVTILYCSDIAWSKDLSAHFFSSDVWSGISFFAFSPSLIGNVPLFVFFWGQGLTFSPWVKVYGKLGFWLKVCSRLDMIYVRVWLGSRIKGDVPHYFHDTNATMMIWKFYAKLVMHAPMWTLKCRKKILVMWC